MSLVTDNLAASCGRILVALSAGWLFAAGAGATATDSELEAQARRIEGKLMAPCCGANTVADHYSQAAFEVRRDIRERLRAGQTERQILDHYVAEYGERILAAPDPRGFNLVAYTLPLLMLLMGGVAVFVAVRRWSRVRPGEAAARPAPPIDPEDAARLERALRKLG